MARRGMRGHGKWVLALAAAIIGITMLVYFLSIFREYQKLAHEQADLRTLLEQEQLRTAQLESELEYTKTLEYVERAAREKLGWIKPGEIRIVPEEDNGASQPALP